MVESVMVSWRCGCLPDTQDSWIWRLSPHTCELPEDDWADTCHICHSGSSCYGHQPCIFHSQSSGTVACPHHHTVYNQNKSIFQTVSHNCCNFAVLVVCVHKYYIQSELHHPSLVYDSVPHHDKSDSGTGGLHNMESQIDIFFCSGYICSYQSDHPYLLLHLRSLLFLLQLQLQFLHSFLLILKPST